MSAHGCGRLPDGFPGDRRIRPAQYFQLDVGIPGRNFIHIHSIVPDTDIAAGAALELEGYLIVDPGGRDAVLERAEAFHTT